LKKLTAQESTAYVPRVAQFRFGMCVSSNRQPMLSQLIRVKGSMARIYAGFGAEIRPPLTILEALIGR
jgi:hypothetical protein